MSTECKLSDAPERLQQAQSEAVPRQDDPTPGNLRRSSTVRFENVAGPAHRPTDEHFHDLSSSLVSSIKDRSDTFDTEISKASSKLEPRWRKQTVLSFDGGGIRGYSSLLILREIMRVVGDIEKEYDSQADSSFRPKAYVPPYNNGGKPRQKKTGKKERNTSPDASSSQVSPVTSLENSELSCSENDKGNSKPCRYLPCHYFDYIGGTSTGGLIAIMLGRLRMGVDECLEEYETFGGEIFGHPRWFSMRGPLFSFKEKYNGRNLQDSVEKVVQRRSSPQQKVVGAGYFGSAKELCKTVVIAYQWKDDSLAFRYGDERYKGIADPATPQVAPSESGAYLFRSYDHWGTTGHNVTELNPGPADNIPIWQVARATTAAPTYFDPISIQNCTFGDGGLGSNNPVNELFYEVTSMHGNNGHVIDLVVSIGTGQADTVKLHSSGWKKLSSYFNATKALATDSEKQHREMLRKREAYRKMHYQRFNLPKEQGLKNMKLDEWKEAGKIRPTKRGPKRRQESTLDKITRLTDAYCQNDDVKKEIYVVADILVRHRRARCSDKRKWELWATGVRYRCTKRDCDKSQKLRPSRHNLESHLKMVHGYDDESEAGREELKRVVDKGICHY